MSILSSLDSIVTVDEETLQSNEKTKLELYTPKMKSMYVVSNVRNRYARTVVTSKYANQDTRAQEATFSIVLPDTAFIAGFIMEIQEKKYEAYVKEKEEAKKEYEEAVSSGRAAAHVAVSARDSNKFTVSVNVEPQSDVTFILTYEELLVRKHSKYEMVVNLHPGQLLDDLGVDININETRPITHVATPALRSGNAITDKVTKNEHAIISKDNDGVVHISFHPTVEQQKEMTRYLRNEENIKDTSEIFPIEGESSGISGQFVVEYEVERDPLGGEVLVNDGYFVHFFAPTELKPIPKHVIFVLDVSGSMGGRKIKQLKEAMQVILNELSWKDYFNIVKFSLDINVLTYKYTWEKVEIPEESELPQSFVANETNIRLVQKVVDQMIDEGATNIHDALIVGVRLTSKGISQLKDTDNKHKPQPIIVFLTDGIPVVSETNPKKIIEMVEKKNDCDNKSAIFTLAFGDDADNEFLKELAIQNSGFLRSIYEAADASLQLQDFYKQISSPLLTNVNFKYSENVKDTTNNKFDILFDGSEFVVAGQVDEMVDGFVFVEGSTLNGVNKFHPTINTFCSKPDVKKEYGSLERLWAYMTIKQLLNKKYEKRVTTEGESSEQPEDENKAEKEKAKKQALALALKYSFVTPVTSLIVVKPDESVVEGKVQDSHEKPEENISRTFRCKKLIKKRKCKIPFPEIVQVEDDSENPFEKIILKNLHIDCNVKNHVASVVEKRNYTNFGNQAHEVTFTIELPVKTVFTEFTMETDGQVFQAKGQDEEQARKDYQKAVSNDLNAALINLQESNKVTVTIYIIPQGKVITMLKYNQCLEIKNGIYEICMKIERELFTDDMTVNVHINEAQSIKNINILPLRSQNEIMKNNYTVIKKINENEAKVEFAPTAEQQEKIVTLLKGIDGIISTQFVMEYEVESDPSSTEDLVTSDAISVPYPYLFVKSNS